MSEPEIRHDLKEPPYDGCSFYEAKSIHNFGTEIILVQDHMGKEFELKPKGTHGNPSRPQKIEIFKGTTACTPVTNYAHANDDPRKKMDLVVRLAVPYSQIKSRKGVYVKELNLIFYTVADRGDIHHPYINNASEEQPVNRGPRLVRFRNGVRSTANDNDTVPLNKCGVTIAANDRSGKIKHVYVAINNSFIIKTKVTSYCGGEDNLVVVEYPCPVNPEILRTHTIDLGQRNLAEHLEACPDSEADGFMLDSDLTKLQARMASNRVAIDVSGKRKDQTLLDSQTRENKLTDTIAMRDTKIKALIDTIKVNDEANNIKAKASDTNNRKLELEIEKLKGRLSYTQGNREEVLEVKRTKLEHSKLESSDRKAAYSETAEKYKMQGTLFKVGVPVLALATAYLVGKKTTKVVAMCAGSIGSGSSSESLSSLKDMYATVAKLYFSPLTILFG